MVNDSIPYPLVDLIDATYWAISEVVSRSDVLLEIGNVTKKIVKLESYEPYPVATYFT